MAAELVAMAKRDGTLAKVVIKGTLTTPPPIPSRPAATPVRAPPWPPWGSELGRGFLAAGLVVGGE